MTDPKLPTVEEAKRLREAANKGQPPEAERQYVAAALRSFVPMAERIEELDQRLEVEESHHEASRERIAELEGQQKKALDIAIRYGGINGDHHKAWVIDQIVRALTGDDYERVVAEACAGEDGPDTYTWDEGIAP